MNIETFPTSSNYEIYSEAKFTPITQEDLKQSFQINKEASTFGEFVTLDAFNSAVNQAEGSWTPRNMSYQLLAEATQIGGGSPTADITNNQSTANQADTTCQTVETLAQTTVDPKAIATDEVKSACNNASKKAATTAYTLASDFGNGAVQLIALSGLGFKGNSVKLHSDTVTSLRSPHITQTAQDFSITGNNSVQIGSNLTNIKSKSFINVTDTHVTQSKNSATVTTGTSSNVATNLSISGTNEVTVMGQNKVAIASAATLGVQGKNIGIFAKDSLESQSQNIKFTAGNPLALLDAIPAASPFDVGNVTGTSTDTTFETAGDVPTEAGTNTDTNGVGSIVDALIPSANIELTTWSNILGSNSTAVIGSTGIGFNTQGLIASLSNTSYSSGTLGNYVLSEVQSVVGTQLHQVWFTAMGTTMGGPPLIPVAFPVPNAVIPPAFPTFPKIPTAELAACLPKDKKKKDTSSNLPPYDATQANIPNTSGPITVQGTTSTESKLPQFDPSKATDTLDPTKNKYTGETLDLPEFNKTNSATSLITSDGVVKLPFTVDGVAANAPTTELGVSHDVTKLGNGYVNPGIYLNKPDPNSEESIANGNFLIDMWEEEFYEDDLDELTTDYLRLGIEDVDLPGVPYDVMSEFLPDFESYFNSKLQGNLSPSDVETELRTGDTELQGFLKSYPDSLSDLVKAYEDFQAKQAIGGLGFLSIFSSLGSVTSAFTSGNIFSIAGSVISVANKFGAKIPSSISSGISSAGGLINAAQGGDLLKIGGALINTANSFGANIPTGITGSLGVLIKDFSLGSIVNLISSTRLISGLGSDQLGLLAQVSSILSQKTEPATSTNLSNYNPSKADPTLTGGYTGDSVNLPSFEPSSTLTLDSKTQQVISMILGYGLGKFGLNAAQSKVITDLTKGKLPTNEEAILLVLQEAGFSSLSSTNITDLVNLFKNVQSGNYLGAILDKDQLGSLSKTLSGFNIGGVSKILDALGSGTELFKALASIPDLLNLMNSYDIPTLSQIGLVFSCLDLFDKAKDVYSSVSALTSNFKNTPNSRLTPSQEAESPVFEAQYFDSTQNNLATSRALDNLPRLVQTYNSLSNEASIPSKSTVSQPVDTGRIAVIIDNSPVGKLPLTIANYVAAENPEVTKEAIVNILGNVLAKASDISLDPCFKLPRLNLNDSTITVNQIENKYLYFSIPNLEALYRDLSLLPSLNDLIRIRVSGFISEDGEFLTPYQTNDQFTPSNYNYQITQFNTKLNLGLAQLEHSQPMIILQTEAGLLYEYSIDAIGTILYPIVEDSYLLK